MGYHDGDRIPIEFSVGDIVRVREWDDMASEYGVRGKAIFCEKTFVPRMRAMCGHLFKVKAVDRKIRSISLEPLEDGCRQIGLISREMLEYADLQEFPAISANEIDLLLTGG